MERSEHAVMWCYLTIKIKKKQKQFFFSDGISCVLISAHCLLSTQCVDENSPTHQVFIHICKIPSVLKDGQSQLSFSFLI